MPQRYTNLDLRGDGVVKTPCFFSYVIKLGDLGSVYPPPSFSWQMSRFSSGFPILKMVHNPGGDCYWVGGRPKI